ncbi:MAG: hypothetical protein M3Q07_07710, partial [Pseudobdellovibrionaceae bacterium]|nr:hypothetical protein [Pseudobdellovibrionaceae bacterium]
MKISNTAQRLVLAGLIWTSGSLEAGTSKTLNSLRQISGKNTLAGIHNRYNTTPDRFTQEMYVLTKRQPALWSGDFLFESHEIASRDRMIGEAKAQWQAGSLINIMWHSCNPVLSEPCTWAEGSGPRSKINDSQWKELITDDSALNRQWKQKLDGIAGH